MEMGWWWCVFFLDTAAAAACGSGGVGDHGLVFRIIFLDFCFYKFGYISITI
jgi:hypothetical protein